MRHFASLALALALLGGCSYGGIAAVGKDKVVVVRNDMFLFGALRKAFVCKPTRKGLARCASHESP